ncbi:Wnt inhibitory factor 1 [Manis javanica]|nr:Wnt inhibitory factor 1 [Manis javanica]
MKEGPSTIPSTDRCKAWSSRWSTGASLAGAGWTVNLAAFTLSLQWGLVLMEGGPSDGEAQRCQCSEGFHGPHCQYGNLF